MLSSPLNAIFVNFCIVVLWCIFRILEFWLGLLIDTFSIFFSSSSSVELERFHDQRKTVVVVGGNFSGLAALWELSHHADFFRIVLIDQRDYFEFTPGILRLFCDPHHFSNLAKALDHDPSKHQVIQGKVTSVVDEESSSMPQKIVTYQAARNGNYSSSSSESLRYDYLILAMGASYTSPISPSSPKELTWCGRFQQWKSAHNQLLAARRVIILGGGAVGVELAAEIIDSYPTKQVTLLDAQEKLVGNFPADVAEYAHQWLVKRGVTLRLGQKLRSWNETSCTLEDGTVLQANVVYVCFGNRPNSEAVSPKSTKTMFEFDGRGTVRVDTTLQVRGGPIRDGSIFASGDVACPPYGNEKQAFQAEIQGKVAARNIIASACQLPSTKLYRYPHDVSGSNQMPLVFVLSLGRYDGVLGFNGWCLCGPFAAVVKWILEHTKVMHMQGRPLGRLIWKIGDAATLFLSKMTSKQPILVSHNHRHSE